MDRVTTPLGGAVPLEAVTDAVTLRGSVQEGNCRAGLEIATATLHPSTSIVTTTGATMGLPPPLPPEAGVKTAAGKHSIACQSA